MRGARLLLAVTAALAMAACARHQPAYYVMDPNTGQQVPVMSQEQFAQLQATQAQPQYAQAPISAPVYAPPRASAGNRGLYAMSPAAVQQSYAQSYPQQVYPPQTDPRANVYAQAQPQQPLANSTGDRGLFNSRPPAPQVYTQPQYAAPQYPQAQYPQAQYPQAQGGPYVAGPNAYAYAPANAQPAYTLDSGDKLRVVVFGQDGISNGYIVDAGGNINLPLVGVVPARGFTTQQLSKMIAERLKQGYVREPHVSVEIEAYRPFFILGEVTNPGQYPYVANMTAETAVAIAGGFAPRADKKSIKLTRNTPGQQVNGDVPLNYPVRPGDTLVIKERWF